ncbi:hypothetical protein MASR1M107_27250 [Ignavibacteriales bacterium]
MQNDFLLNSMMSKLASDSKFVGIFMMIIGVLICLTIVGLPLGLPYVFAGIRAKDGGAQIEQYLMTNDNILKVNAYENYQKHFFILKVLFIVGLVVAVLAIAIMGVALIAFFKALSGGMH